MSSEFRVQSKGKYKGTASVIDLPFNEATIKDNLKTSFIGKPLYFHQKIDSTNNEAYALAVKGAGEGTAVVADYQTKGRGRLGRIWESPKGVNIYTSIILRPDILPAAAPKITLMSALAVAETISGYSVEKPEVKWPNDILINSKKVSGILAEMKADNSKLEFVVLGIGINVNMTMDVLPDGLKHTATSLKEEAGKNISRIDFLNSVYSNVEKWYEIFLRDGFKPVLQAWKGYFNMAGKSVNIIDFEKTLEGTVMTIDDDGLLVVRERTGRIIKVASADVVLKQG